MSRNKLYSERLEICITPKLRKELDKICKVEQITMNEAIRRILDSYVK